MATLRCRLVIAAVGEAAGALLGALGVSKLTLWVSRKPRRKYQSGAEHQIDARSCWSGLPDTET